MKKVDENKTREINGGRWQCGNCGHKTLTVAAMHLHLAAVHNAYNIYTIRGCKTNTWTYHWCL